MIPTPNADYVPIKNTEDITCIQCGADVWIAEDGTAYHWGGGMTGIDHDLDADHTAVPDTEDRFDEPAQIDGSGART